MKIDDFVLAQEELGEEFSKILHENLWFLLDEINNTEELDMKIMEIKCKLEYDLAKRYVDQLPDDAHDSGTYQDLKSWLNSTQDGKNLSDISIHTIMAILQNTYALPIK